MSEQEEVVNIDDKQILKEQKKLEKKERKELKKKEKLAKKELKKQKKAKNQDGSPKEKSPLGCKLIAIIQLVLLVGLYGFVGVKALMMRFSDNAIEYVEDFVELLDLKDIALNENFFLVVGLLFLLLMIGVLISSIFLLLNKKKLRVVSLVVSVIAILAAVVFTALMIAFEGDKMFLLALVPHFGWYGGVILYYSLKLADRPDSFGDEEDESEEDEKFEEEEDIEIDDSEEESVEAPSIGESVEKVEVVRKVSKKIKKKTKPKATKGKRIKKKKVPDGRGYTVCLLIIAITHTFVLGIINLLASLINLCSTFNADWDILFQNFIRTFEVKNIEISQLQIRTVFAVYVLVAIMFIVSGVGMFRKSSILRSFTVYLVGTIAVFSGLSLLLQGFQAFDRYMALYFAWFVFVLVYLNLRKLDIYFAPKARKDEVVEA